MSILHEIAVRAKFDGAVGLEWGEIRRPVSDELCLQNLPGDSDVERLKVWAQRQGLLMDFEVEVGGFSSEIGAVTFWNNPQAAEDGVAGQVAAAEVKPCPKYW